MKVIKEKDDIRILVTEKEYEKVKEQLQLDDIKKQLDSISK